MAKRICLHIGAHKCASTMIQANCLKNINRIHHDLGLRYIKSEQRGNSFYTLFLQIASRLFDFNDEKLFDDRIKKARENFNTIIKKYRDDKIFISWEGFLGHCGMHKYGSLYPYTKYYFKALKEITKDHDVKIILVIRRQDEFVESCYLQQIKECQILTFSDYMKAIDIKNLSWLTIVNQIEQWVGRDNILIHPFEEIKKGSRRFLDTILSFASGKDSSNLDINIIDGANPSISGKGVELALKIYPLANDHKEMKIISRFLFNHLSSVHFGKARLMSEPQKKAIIKHCEADNKKLSCIYKLDLSHYTQTTPKTT